jgi:hypothetical protein
MLPPMSKVLVVHEICGWCCAGVVVVRIFKALKKEAYFLNVGDFFDIRVVCESL